MLNCNAIPSFVLCPTIVYNRVNYGNYYGKFRSANLKIVKTTYFIPKLEILVIT